MTTIHETEILALLDDAAYDSNDPLIKLCHAALTGDEAAWAQCERIITRLRGNAEFLAAGHPGAWNRLQHAEVRRDELLAAVHQDRTWLTPKDHATTDLFAPPPASPPAEPVSTETFSAAEHAAWVAANDRGLHMTAADLRALVFAALAAAEGEDCQCCVLNDCECTTRPTAQDGYHPHAPEPWT